MSVLGKEFIQFVNCSPSPFHAVATCVQWLKSEGFTQIKENADWTKLIKPNGKYYFTRNQSTLIAFGVGGQFVAGNGFNMLGAHTDSPCLKLKPVSNVQKEGYLQMGVQTYGGGLWHTWFDRDLALGGRVIISEKKGEKDEEEYREELVFLNKPIARIPSLAIHLTDRSTRGTFKFNDEDHLLPVIASTLKGQLGESEEGNHHGILLEALSEEIGCKVSDIRDFELSLCDAQPACIGGLKEEYIFAPRLDNLMSCWTGLQSFLKTSGSLDQESRTRMICFFDNEEVGSTSSMGANSSLLNEVMARVNESCGGNNGSNENSISTKNSFMISSDMSHAVHPNYAGKHEGKHKPQIHSGLVIKVNANQRYATTDQSRFLIKELARIKSIPIQEFVVRNDSPCGSTIGPMISSNTGVRTVDVGGPMLSMHSIREMCGTLDVDYSVDLFMAYWNNFTKLDQKLQIE